MTEKSIATAADVRNWLVAHPKSLAKLDAKAQATVLPVEGKFPKGRLAASAYGVFNSGQAKAVYSLGNTREVAKVARKAAVSDRKAAARKAARQGASIGKRGPIPAKFIVTHKG